MTETQLKDYLLIPSFAERYPEFPESRLRWLIVKKKENGLEKVIRRIGRRIYIHVPSFLQWVEGKVDC